MAEQKKKTPKEVLAAWGVRSMHGEWSDEKTRAKVLGEVLEAVTSRLSLYGPVLVYDVGECTCGAPNLYPHEQHCGIEPFLDLTRVEGWDEMVERLRADG